MNKLLRYWNSLSTAKRVALVVAVLLAVAYYFCLPRRLFMVSYSTVVTDRHGTLLGARIAADGQWRFPPRQDVPEKVERCLVAFEDRHFYYHWGVDPAAICRAMYQNLRAGRVVSGGSTLTMQVVRLMRGNPRTVKEKLIEMVLATRLEFRASKRELLALYVSHAPFGGNVVGLDAAAWRYFGHDADELSWAEAATLAVLPNAPSMIHLAKGRPRLLDKRNRLLRRLLDTGAIDASTYELAVAEPLPGEPLALPQIAPCLVDYFYKTRGGLSTRSTVDVGVQQRVEAIAERWSSEFRRSDIRNLAILVLDIPANRVVAYCGNVQNNRSQEGNQVDIIQSPRSTGSILKPFLYAAMQKEGELLPHTLLPDIPINVNGFAPQNFSLQFEGAVPASEALARSLNIPAVSMLQQYGVPKFHHLLRQFGFGSINRSPSHYGLSLVLGGAETTLWEVTNAYKRLAELLSPSLSQRKEPASLLWLEDEDPDAVVPYDKSGSFISQGKDWQYRAEWAGAAWLTLSALTELNRPEEIDWKSISSIQPVAWKTGTSYGFRDAWAVGVTPRYAVGVWVGNATGEGKPELVGARTAGPVMFDVFNTLPSSAWFTRPDEGLTEVETCHQSGCLKGRFCDEVDTIYVVPTGLRSAACPYHRLVTVTADGQWRVYADSGSDEPVVQKSWFVLPPVWEWYYRQHHPEYRPLPPLRRGLVDEGGTLMQFIYPPMNAHIRLPRQLDGSEGQLTVELAHSNPHAAVFWHLDDHYLMQTEDFHKVTFSPSTGKHSLTAVDETGNTVSTTFVVESK